MANAQFTIELWPKKAIYEMWMKRRDRNTWFSKLQADS